MFEEMVAVDVGLAADATGVVESEAVGSVWSDFVCAIGDSPGLAHHFASSVQFRIQRIPGRRLLLRNNNSFAEVFFLTIRATKHSSAILFSRSPTTRSKCFHVL